MFEHQDWNTVVFNKKVENARQVVKRENNATVTASGKPAWKIEQQVDGDTGKGIAYVGSDVAKAIVAARVAMKLSQKQLAQKINIQEKEIKDIESCKAVENRQLIARIKKALNM